MNAHIFAAREGAGFIARGGSFVTKPAYLAQNQARRSASHTARLTYCEALSQRTEYFVNAPPAWLREFGPSAA